MESYNKQYLLDVISKYEEKYNKVPTRREIRREFGLTDKPFVRVFGSWEQAKIEHKAISVAKNSEFELDTYLDDDLLYGDLVRAEMAQEELDKVFGNKNDFKILSLSDIEFPYANTAMINHAVKFAKNLGVKDVVLNGDVTHQDFFSKHAKHTYVSPEEEFSQLVQFISWLLTKFETITLVSGNHDRIATRHFNKVMPNLASYKFMVRTDLLAAVEEVFKDQNVFYAHNWYTRIKDVVYMHHDSFTILPMRTTINASKIVKKMGIKAAAWVQGHTHKTGCYVENGETFF